MNLLLEAPKDWYPGTAISLGEMMRVFESAYLFRVSRTLERWSSIHIGKVGNNPLSPQQMKDLIEAADFLKEDLGPIDLPFTVKLIDRFRRTCEDGAITGTMAAQLLTRLTERIEDELSLILVLQIPRERSEYFEKTDGFGPEVSASFPDVGFDLEESHTCYALGRYNAAVYHLMRVVEVGVQKFGNDLGIKDAHTLNWGKITDQCHAKIRALSAGSDKVQRSEAMNHLDGVRSVWRNSTMHPRPTAYTEPQARDILINAKALMVSLAEFL